MRALSATQILDLWEEGHASLPFERAVSLLAAAMPDLEREELELLSIGRRDARLLELREWAFGSSLEMTASCPVCGQALEMVIPIGTLRTPPAVEEPESRIAMEEYAADFRPPNTRDLAVCDGLDPEEGRRALLNGCILEATRAGEMISAHELPNELLTAVEDRIAAIDPQADVLLDFACPDCHERWSEAFDIVSFFWAEIDAWARRLLLEVNVLARAFGWSEDDILRMSAARRQIYFAMAQA